MVLLVLLILHMTNRCVQKCAISAGQNSLPKASLGQMQMCTQQKETLSTMPRYIYIVSSALSALFGDKVCAFAKMRIESSNKLANLLVHHSLERRSGGALPAAPADNQEGGQSGHCKNCDRRHCDNEARPPGEPRFTASLLRAHCTTCPASFTSI